MSKKGLLVLLMSAGLAAPMACKPEGAKTGGSPSAPADDSSKPVARLGDETITNAQLIEHVKAQVTRAEAEHAEKIHGIKAQGLDALIEERLIARKAKAEGIEPEALIKREVEGKIAEPSPEQIQKLYDDTKATGRPMPPFEQVKGDIVKFLKERESGQARERFVTELQASAKVEKMLPPLLLPAVEVEAVGPSKGPENAPVTIVAFSDFECPYCSRAEEAIKQVMEAYAGKVRLVYRDFPLDFHAKAQKASEAALCAQDQNKYWEMHERLFANQQALDLPQLKQHAEAIGLDAVKFNKCLESGDKAKLVEASKAAGEKAGVTGTPAFFINGRPLSGARPFEQFKEIIDYELSVKGS